MTANQICFNCFSGTNGTDPCPVCGFENNSIEQKPHHLPAGTILHEGYLIGRVLGQGGFGITYLGYDLASHQRLAIKEYFPAGIVVRQNGEVQSSSIENKSIFKRGIDSFNKEARILSELSNYPNIVNIHTFFFENGTGYFVMEFIDGMSLKDYLTSRGGRIDFQETLALLLPVMHILQAVHHAGMLHRDIAPDNIYITKEGQTKLMDFGAARFHTFQETQSVRTIVKPGYAPMEQYASQSAQGPWTDVYAMGATIYRTLTGAVPPDAPTRAMRDEMQSPLQMGFVLPTNADYAIMRAMAPQIVFRFRAMNDFIQALTLPDGALPVHPSVQNPIFKEPSSEVRKYAGNDTEAAEDEADDVPSWVFILLILLLAVLMIWLIRLLIIL